MWEVGRERTPNRIDTAARVRFHRALGNPIPEYDEHSRHLINTSVQAREVRRREHSEITRQQDVIIEFTRGPQCNRQVTRELRARCLTAALGDVGSNRHCSAAHLIDQGPVTPALKGGLRGLVDLKCQRMRPPPD